MEYKIIYSNRKTIAIEVKEDGSIIVKAPKRAGKRQVEAFVESKADWIQRAAERQAARADEYAKIPKLTNTEIRLLADQAARDIAARVRYFAPIVGTDYNRITIRNQTTRWGSCSGKGNLNFNCLLMLAPEDVRDYVVVHELCHRLQMNHSAAFWAEVGRVMPDYASKRKWLKENGPRLIAMLKVRDPKK